MHESKMNKKNNIIICPILCVSLDQSNTEYMYHLDFLGVYFFTDLFILHVGFALFYFWH